MYRNYTAAELFSALDSKPDDLELLKEIAARYHAALYSES